MSPTARDVLRRLRFPLALAALILAAGTAVALLQPHAGPGYLDPHDPGPFGARALAQILAQRGQHVVRVGSPQEAARAAADDATLVITGPAFLDRGDLAAIGRLPGDRVLVEPDGPALRALAPSIIATGTAAVAQAEPDCRLAAAQLAGDAEMGGVTMRAAAPALPPSVTPVALAAAPAPSAGTSAMRGGQACYRMRTGPSLVRYVSGRRTITVLGTGTPLTNGRLADRGDAALALNLLADRPTIVWLTPGPATLAADAGGRKSLTDLIPWAADLVAIQLLIAAAAAALWRSRRLGPLVTEPLPVVVRAAETVEGHGRLYRSRRSRDRAAQALRAAVAGRLAARLGLPQAAGPATITAAVAARTGRNPAAVDADLFGPVPASDQALVQLASSLDNLEKEVRQT